MDGSYTVFGEVVEGMETVEKIEIAKTNRADRPLDNIRILKATVVEKLKSPAKDDRNQQTYPVKRTTHCPF